MVPAQTELKEAGSSVCSTHTQNVTHKAPLQTGHMHTNINTHAGRVNDLYLVTYIQANTLFASKVGEAHRNRYALPHTPTCNIHKQLSHIKLLSRVSRVH